MSLKSQREEQKHNIKLKLLLRDIQKKIETQKSKCSYPGCINDSINSHFHQQNGVLDIIAKNRHLVQLGAEDIFNFSDDGIKFRIQKLGIKKAFSLPLFCNFHDTAIFTEVESNSPDFSTYKAFLLLSYRAICAELKKKLDSIKMFDLFKQSELILQNQHSELMKFITSFYNGTKRGIDDLIITKKSFEDELFNDYHAQYEYVHYEYDLIPICVSAIFSPGTVKELMMAKEGELPAIFINIIPQENKLHVLIGFHNSFKNPWLESYMTSWSNLNKVQLTEKLTDLVTTRVETWCCSPEYFENIPKKTIKDFLEYWQNNAMNYSLNQQVIFNLFENSLN